MKKLVKQIGNLLFTLLFFKKYNRLKKIKERSPTKTYSLQIRKAMALKKFGGVKIFRDDFSGETLWENGQDWLSLGERQEHKAPVVPGKKIGGYRNWIKSNCWNNQYIKKLLNIRFKINQSEGIQEKWCFFELFKNLILKLFPNFWARSYV